MFCLFVFVFLIDSPYRGNANQWKHRAPCNATAVARFSKRPWHCTPRDLYPR